MFARYRPGRTCASRPPTHQIMEHLWSKAGATHAGWQQSRNSETPQSRNRQPPATRGTGLGLDGKEGGRRFESVSNAGALAETTDRPEPASQATEDDCRRAQRGSAESAESGCLALEEALASASFDEPEQRRARFLGARASAFKRKHREAEDEGVEIVRKDVQFARYVSSPDALLT